MLNIRFRDRANPWPGFVDLFSNLVIIMIFLLIVFVFLWTTTSVFNKNTGVKIISDLKQTTAQQERTILQMAADEAEAKRLLILARGQLENLEKNNIDLKTELTNANVSMDELIKDYETKVAELQSQGIDMEREISELTATLTQNKDLTAAELAKLNAALDAAEEKSAKQKIQYVEMSARLNKALADKVAELNKVAQYQSEFYKAIKMALGDRTTIRQEGDRFIVSSDILFPSGEYALSTAGKDQLKLIANVIKDLENKIPTDTNWIIRVDGHTDKKQVVRGTKNYKDNTELSLLRATAVAKELEKAGVSPRRLVPSGFGEMHPVVLGSDADSLKQNRRIELQLTNR